MGFEVISADCMGQHLRYIAIVVLFVWTGTVEAQVITFDSIYEARLHAEAYFDLGIPTRAFADNMDRNGVGAGGELLYRVQGPAWIGLGAHSFRMDKYSVNYFEYFDGEPYEIKELTATRAVLAHLLFRFQPAHGRVITPYAQAGAGWHWFYTNTKLEDVEAGEVYDTFNDYMDTKFGFALQAGFMLTLPALPNMGLDLRMGYYGNASVQYLTFAPEEADPVSGYPIDSFVLEESVIDMLGVHIGFFWRW